ncbi:hypothetical protein KI655_05980 [Vibrio sp. D404a]|uniref:hypothetical protein n=1 Tax=unclassified Vibrio TaxID=2614977 RepID=UPI0025537302|nr:MULTISPECIES: hypothetical protein [unclassified Vibrio]MDK9736845.1 hypothetical protein [Vibrio sp. D404a]MDK9795737.1 hypothetical protein [Vibrio sp. D449a]
MLVFTTDSLKLVLDLLKTADYTQHNIYFNDGQHQHQLVDFEIQCEDFECNGMFQRIEVRYRMKMAGGEAVEFSFHNGQLRMEPMKATSPKHDIGTPSKIAEYNF